MHLFYLLFPFTSDILSAHPPYPASPRADPDYPLLEKRDKDFAREFYQIAKESNTNLYYYPKPNHYMEVDDFALFSLKSNLTPENLKIESLYRKDLIPRDLRGKLHTLLRKDKGIEEKYIQKKFFYESRKLFNLSWQWNEFRVSQEQLEYDLIDRVQEWYAGPSEINIATTNVCNLKCIMCKLHNPDLKKTHKTQFFSRKQFLDEKIVYSILDYAEKKNVANVAFTAAGEALLDHRLVDFIAYAKDKNIPLISLVTNGVLLEDKGIELLNAGLNRMTISIDGATQETYRKIRGTDLEKVERGVRKCVEYARAINANGGDIEMQLNCVLVNEEVIHEEKLYLEKWKEYRDIIKNIYFTDLVISDTKGRRNKRDACFNKTHEACSYPWLGFQVDVYGNVSVCCTMQDSSLREKLISIGNVYNQKVYDIWNSEAMRELRKENLRQQYSKFEICKKCVERYRAYVDDEGYLNNLVTQAK